MVLSFSSGPVKLGYNYYISISNFTKVGVKNEDVIRYPTSELSVSYFIPVVTHPMTHSHADMTYIFEMSVTVHTRHDTRVRAIN